MDQRSIVMLGTGLWGLLTLAAIYCGVDWIERDLTWRSRAALAAEGQRWTSVHYDGRDATLGGVAPSPDARAKAGAVLRGLPGVRVVYDLSTVERGARR